MTSPMDERWGMLLAILATLGGCGGETQSWVRPQAPPPEATAAPAIQQLVLEIASGGQTCDKLLNRFVGLPVDSGATGAWTGMAPIGGRWWIRNCSVAREATGLRLQLAGPAWYRADEKDSGFSVHQDVYFNVAVQMVGTLNVGYEPASRLASLWFTPTQPTDVTIEALAPISPRAETFGASLIDIITLGSVPSMTAQDEVVSQGERRFRGRLGSGVTLTMDLGRNDQIDLALGQLPVGQAPIRPYTDGLPWLVNERDNLFRGGIQVAGPFPPQTAIVDVSVEGGQGADFALICADVLQMSFNSMSSGDVPRVPAAAVLQRGQFLPGPLQSWPVEARCPWYLVSTTRARSARVAVRVRAGQSLPSTAGLVTVRIGLLWFGINPRKPSGEHWDWDLKEDAPDPEISLVHKGGRDPLMPKKQDTYKSSMFVAAPNPLDLAPGMPIQIVVVDKDMTDDDLIGKAVLQVEDVSRGPEITLPLQLGGVVTGRVGLRVDVVGR